MPILRLSFDPAQPAGTFTLSAEGTAGTADTAAPDAPTTSR